MWDPSRFALSRLVWLCRDDHRWVESHRLLAQDLGLLVRHGGHPCSRGPMFRHGRWVLIDDGWGLHPDKGMMVSAVVLSDWWLRGGCDDGSRT